MNLHRLFLTNFIYLKTEGHPSCRGAALLEKENTEEFGNYPCGIFIFI